MTARMVPPILAVSGASGAGKTRLLARLIPALARRGVTVAVLKHTRHPHPFDVRGKDTDVLRRAGAIAAAIEGPAGMAYFGPPAGGLAALVRRLPPVDLVLAEGFRDAPVPRVEVHRRRVSREFLCASDRRVFAVVTDRPPPRPIRVFAPGDVERLADAVCDRFGLGRERRSRPRLRAPPVVSSVRANESERTALGRTNRMAKKTTGKTRSRGGARGSGGGRSAAGRKGGNATLRARGPEFYAEIGRKGGKRRAKAAARAKRSASPRASASRTAGARSAGGARSRRRSTGR